MDWCRLGTSYYLDAAVLRAGEAAEVLFLRCVAYSAAKESRGRIDKAVLPMLTPSRTQARVTALVREELLIDEGTTVLIRSWDRWQEALDVEADRRRKDRDRKRDERAAVRAASEDVSQDGPGTVQAVSSRKEVEVEVEVEKNTCSTDVEPAPDAFEEFWTTYPRRVGKGQALKAWARVVKNHDPEQITAGALRLAQQPGREEKFTPHPATWLNGLRWLDEPSRFEAPREVIDPRQTRLRGVRL